MHIVCPHCSTSYALNPATLGAAGRNVRCSRCKEIWLARPEDAVETAPAVPAFAEANQRTAEADAAAEWEALAAEEDGETTPVVDSPSIAGDWPSDDSESPDEDADWQTKAHDDASAETGRRLPWFRGLMKRPAARSAHGKSYFNATTACAGMGALAIALVVWRADVVRLMPQTATFYKMVGLEVNLRGVLFKDVKVTTETVEGKPVLVIEGMIVGQTRKAVDLPRLRFSVRDAQGAEIYAWNTVLEQTVLKPGETAWFKSRLASPPAEGRSIDIRFFNRRDIAGGSI
jgi:predicted Zn finger-like uncharacterized protein